MFWGSGNISITQKAPEIHWREKIPSGVWQWDLGACWAEKKESGALGECCWRLIPEMDFTSRGIKRFTGASVNCQRIESRLYNPIKESSGSFSYRSQEIFGVLEIILCYCFTHLVLLFALLLSLEEKAAFVNLIFALMLSTSYLRSTWFLLEGLLVLPHLFWGSVVKLIHRRIAMYYWRITSFITM